MPVVTIEYQDCPDQGDDLPSQCLTQDLVNSVYDLLDDLVDIVNVHLLAEGSPAIAYVVRQVGGCFTFSTYSDIIGKLKEVANSGRLPKRVVDCDGNPFPAPANAADVAIWLACDGYYDNYAELSGCYVHVGGELGLGDCVTLDDFNWLYVLIGCAISGGCIPACDECVKCSIHCKLVWEVIYDCATNTWGTVTLASYACDDDCIAEAWYYVDQPETGKCRYRKVECSTYCCTQDSDCSDATPPDPPPTPFDCPCADYFCKWTWEVTYDCDTKTWGTVTLADYDCVNDCVAADWAYVDQPTPTTCRYRKITCGTSPCDDASDCSAGGTAPAPPADPFDCLCAEDCTPCCEDPWKLCVTVSDGVTTAKAEVSIDTTLTDCCCTGTGTGDLCDSTTGENYGTVTVELLVTHDGVFARFTVTSATFATCDTGCVSAWIEGALTGTVPTDCDISFDLTIARDGEDPLTVTATDTYTEPCVVCAADCTDCGGTCDDTLSSVSVDISSLGSGTCGCLTENTYGSVTLSKTADCPDAWYQWTSGDNRWYAYVTYDSVTGCWFLTVKCAIPFSPPETVWLGCKGGDTPVGVYTVDATWISTGCANTGVLTLEVT